MHYFTKGSGPHRTILLHGFLGSGRNLASFAQSWSERDPTRTFFVCDMLGHGQSPPLPKDPTLFSLVPPILELIDGAKKVTLVGHSLGGRAALVAACEHKAVEQVMMLDIGPAPIGQRNAGLEQMLRAFLAMPPAAASRQDMRTLLLQQGLSGPSADWLLMNLVAGDEGLRWRVDRQALAELGAATRGDDLWRFAEKVAHKLRVVYGTASPFVPADEAERLERMGVDVRAIEGAGHYLHVDALAQLVDAVATDAATAK